MKYFSSLLSLLLACSVSGFTLDHDYLVQLFTNYFTTIRLTDHSSSSQCPVSKPGTQYGEATMFQENWVHGKTGACGFEKPVSSRGEGFFAAVGGSDWDNGFGCGSCAELQFNGNTIIVNVADRCGGCSKGWFDLGGPAWRALTNNMAPGHVHGVRSRWVTCPHDLSNRNIRVYVKPGSHAWDARFQPTGHKRPVTGMMIKTGSGWRSMKKCENFMFCKPSGVTLHAQFSLRVVSDTGNIDTQVSRLQGGNYIDMGSNNEAGSCGASGGSGSAPPPASTTSPVVVTSPPTTTSSWSGSSVVDCSREDGLFPDPDNCRGFIKCAQGDRYPMQCNGGLYFDPVTYNCNWPFATDCNGRPVY